jgi:hypothetical protein
MSITAHGRTGGDTGAMGRLPMLASPLAALLYPFALEGFNTSVTRIAAGAYTLSWLSAAACLALAFAMPLIAMLAAMSFSEIGNPTVAQLRAKRTALLAVAAPTLFTFVGVVLTMLHDPVPDTWLWDRTVRAAFPHTACMGLSLSRVHHAIFVVLCCFILCSTRAASILSSRPHITVAVAHSDGHGRRFFSAAEGLALHQRETETPSSIDAKAPQTKDIQSPTPTSDLQRVEPTRSAWSESTVEPRP